MIEPSSALANLGPSLPPTCTVSNVTLSFVANVIFPLASCFTSRFLPATNSTVLPALMDSPFASTVLPVFLVPSAVALAFNVNAALLIALTTFPTVATLFSSFAFGSAVPVAVVLIVPVLTFTPFASTTKEESAGFTEIVLPVVSFCKPFPVFTLYLMVDTLLSVVSTTAVVPSPFTKFTVSYGFTKSLAASLFCKFQPACNTSPTVAALFLLTWPASVPNVGAVALVIGSVLFGLAPSKLPATFVITLPPLFKPSWFTVTVFALGFVKETPVGVIFTTLLLASLNSALVKPVSCFANLNLIVFSSL